MVAMLDWLIVLAVIAKPTEFAPPWMRPATAVIEAPELVPSAAIAAPLKSTSPVLTRSPPVRAALAIAESNAPMRVPFEDTATSPRRSSMTVWATL